MWDKVGVQVVGPDLFFNALVTRVRALRNARLVDLNGSGMVGSVSWILLTVFSDMLAAAAVVLR